jgi:hypothetical protein
MIIIILLKKKIILQILSEYLFIVRRIIAYEVMLGSGGFVAQ